jgi:type I restriction-modification system DNA methylase subunit
MKSKIKGKSTRIPSPFDTTTRKTEWTCASKISEWINNIVKDKNIPLGRAEVETKTRADLKRSDIVIFEKPSSDKILCVIEMKQPYFNAFDEKELKEPARIKAVERKAKYFATSNFKEFIWWCTERVNANVSIEEQICDKYALSEIENIDLIEEPRYKNRILSGLEYFLTDLYEVHTGKKSEPKHPIDEILIYLIHLCIKRLSNYYRQIIEDRCHKDMKFRGTLEKWFAEQQWNFFHQPTDYEKAARQAAYLLVNKILFYDLLQTKRPDRLDPLSIPEDLTKGGLLQNQLQAFFDYVLKEIDYETIYDADFIDQTAFPDRKEVVDEIKSLIRTLNLYDFSKIGYDIIGRIFERLIPAEERHNLGQYFTNADVVDIILKFCLQHEKDKILDPACGAGTFLVRAYKHKQIMNQMLKHEEILRTLWGVDIAKFPAHLATINLAINDLSVDENYPYIIKEDFFNLHYGGKEEFKEHKKKELVGLGEKKIKIPYPKIVDCIIGNPPYTRQEEIPEIAGEDYKKRLIQSALYDGKIKLANISKRAGIHAYFFIHGTKFLKDGGHFGFIVSNSWLDVDYGKALQEFFLENYKIISIIESKVERWFEEADINTCIIILQKCKDKKERDKNLVRFVYLKKRLRDFIPAAQDMWEKQVERLNAIDNFKKTILAHNEFYENEDLRIYPKSQKELWDEAYDAGEKKYVGSKWGKYLRAPDIFFTILEKGKDKLVPLKKIAEVRRGFTTGANEFFYLTEEEIKRRKIENEFWMHKDKKGKWVPNYVIKSPRECKSVVVKPDDLKYRVLMIHKDKKDLKGTNILKYIRWGEKQGFHKRPTCASRKNWYDLGKRQPGKILIAMIQAYRHIVFYNPSEVYPDHNVFEILTNDNNSTLVAAFLSSAITMLTKEFYGRSYGGGSGPLKVEGIDIEKLPVIRSSGVSPKLIKMASEQFENLLTNSLENTFLELGVSLTDEISVEKIKPNRRELDKVIMSEILGLTDDEQLEVYRAVIDLVKSRIERAKSFGKRKKIKEGIDIDLFMKTIKDKIGDDTVGKLYREKVKKSKIPLRTVHLPVKTDKIRIDSEIFGFRLISGRKHIDCKTEDEAKYLKIFLEAGMEKIKIPKQELHLKQILPELQQIKQKIDKVIESDISTIINVKLRRKLEHLIWQEVMK